MKRILLALGLACLFVVGFANRVDDTVQIPFSFSAAAGWLNQNDGREFALKGTHTVNKFGSNGDVDTAEESVWDGDDIAGEGTGPGRCFTILGTTAQAVYLSSDDENDASDNNAVSITVQYLDSTWATQTLVVPLGAALASGTTSAQISSGTILRINRMFATTTAPAGNVYASTDTNSGSDGVPDDPATQMVAGITLGENQTLQACYTTPLGFDALMSQFCIGNLSQAAASQDVTFRLRKAVEGAAARTTELLTLADAVQECIVHDPPIMFAEKTDIELTADAAGASQGTSGTFDLILVPNDS